jgi:hypothetical protein
MKILNDETHDEDHLTHKNNIQYPQQSNIKLTESNPLLPQLIKKRILIKES